MGAPQDIKLLMLRFVFVIFGLAICDADPWDSLREDLSSWAGLDLDANFAINAGDASGTRFTWATEGFSMSETALEGASLSKWPAAVMITGLVNDGTMSFDDRVNKYVKWWSKDEKDSRSAITLRHLLSFTSGYESDYVSEDGYCMRSFEHCAEQLYGQLKHTKPPGTTWTYLSCHLQFAGAMAVAASGLPIQELFSKYLYSPFNMTKTSWGPAKNPSMAGGITTTGTDFENMLHRLLTYKVLPKFILDQMETDYSKAPVSPSGDGWFGHYGMGHWWECLGYGTPNERSPLPKRCTDAHIQAGPGEFGYYPLLDRSGGGGEAGPARPAYYFQVVLQEPDPLSGVPEYLRILTKPVVDLLIGGGSMNNTTKSALLKAGGGLLRRDIAYIQSELGRCKCARSKQEGEPWASLSSGLPADEKDINRQAIMDKGGAFDLHDVTEVHQRIGNCQCAGRRKF